MHFKELFMLDGRSANFSKNDAMRRNTVTQLLSDWGLLEVLYPQLINDKVSVRQMKILPFKEKPNWTLVSKYSIGNQNPQPFSG